MRFVQAMLGVAAAVCLTAAPVRADQHGSVKGATMHGPAAKAPAPKAAPSTTPTSTSTPTTTTSTTTKTSKKTPTTTTSTTTTTSSTNTTNTTTISPLAAKIQSHPKLAARLKALLPDGMTLNRAAMGFKSQGQLIAALHVSRNLGIPFRLLRRDMTGPDHMSLGQAIQKERLTANATTEVQRAENEAAEDVKLSTAPVTHKNKRGGSQ